MCAGEAMPRSYGTGLLEFPLKRCEEARDGEAQLCWGQGGGRLFLG